MKRILKLSVALLFTFNFLLSTVQAQTPQKMSYQAVIRDASNNLVVNTNIGIQVSVLQSLSTGSAVYVERHFPTTNGNGLATLEIGTGTIISGDFSTINWESDSFFVKTEIDLNGGASYTITSTNQLLSVPYALHAKTAESISGAHYLGEFYGGGIIFWLDETGQHGLIVSLDDLDGGNGIEWSGTTDTLIGVSAQSMTDGISNTVSIIVQDATPNKAATLCDSYSSGGFTDWYLPSHRELYLLCSQDILIDRILDNDGDPTTNGFSQAFLYPTYGRYWSSTERNVTYAWYYAFSNGNISSRNKSEACRVRAVRAF